MYVESHNKLKKDLLSYLKYSPNEEENQQIRLEQQQHHDQQMVVSGDDHMDQHTLDQPKQMGNKKPANRKNNKTNNIVNMAMSMANSTTSSKKSSRRKKKKTNDESVFDDQNMIDMSGNNAASNADLQYIILQSDTKIFNCGNCEQQFISEEFLKQHMKKAHSIEVEIIDPAAAAAAAAQQQAAEQQAAHEQQAQLLQQQQVDQLHIAQNILPHTQLIYLCHLCENRQFTSEIQLNHHMFIHQEINAGTLTDNPFPICSCDHCFAIPTANQQITETIEQKPLSEPPPLALSSNTMQHQQQQHQHHQQQKVSTNATGKKVVNNVKGPATYSCNVCGKSSFKTNNRLMKHMRIHSNSRPFACEICKKEYNASSSLKAHQRMTHNMTSSGEVVATGGNGTIAVSTVGVNGTNAPATTVINSALQCSICAKTFLKPYHLTVHMNTVHDKDRPHPCSQCSYRFSTQSKLSAHVRSAHTEPTAAAAGAGTIMVTSTTPTIQISINSTDLQAAQTITTTAME